MVRVISHAEKVLVETIYGEEAGKQLMAQAPRRLLQLDRIATMEAYYAAQEKYQPAYDTAVKAAQAALDEALEPTRRAYYAALDAMEHEAKRHG